MDNKDKMNVLLDKLENIVQELEQLTTLADDSIAPYMNNISVDQTLVGKLDDLLLVATHETASDLFFIKERIISLIRYIEFRSKYNHIPGNILKEVIDCDNTDVLVKLKLKEYANDCDYRLLFNEIKSDWVSYFQNTSFDKIADLF